VHVRIGERHTVGDQRQGSLMEEGRADRHQGELDWPLAQLRFGAGRVVHQSAVALFFARFSPTAQLYRRTHRDRRGLGLHRRDKGGGHAVRSQVFHVALHQLGRLLSEIGQHTSFVVRVHFELRYGQCTLRTVTQARAQAIAVALLDQAGFAIDDLQCALDARRHTIATAIAFLFVDNDNVPCCLHAHPAFILASTSAPTHCSA